MPACLATASCSEVAVRAVASSDLTASLQVVNAISQAPLKRQLEVGILRCRATKSEHLALFPSNEGSPDLNVLSIAGMARPSLRPSSHRAAAMQVVASFDFGSDNPLYPNYNRHGKLNKKKKIGSETRLPQLRRMVFNRIGGTSGSAEPVTQPLILDCIFLRRWAKNPYRNLYKGISMGEWLLNYEAMCSTSETWPTCSQRPISSSSRKARSSA